LAEDAFITSNRAWLVPRAAELEKPLVNGQYVYVSISVQNTGRTPANKIRDSFEIRIAHQLDAKTEWIGVILPENTTCERKRMSQVSDVPIMYPTESGGYKIHDMLAGPIVDDDVFRGLKTFYIQGCLEYMTMDVLHHSAYCFFFRTSGNVADWKFMTCLNGNYAD
jgi:hypothetical protein